MDDLDSVFRALADNRRRLALYHVQDHQSVTLPDLAELVAEDEYEEDVHHLSAETVKDVYLSLYHEHVPILEQADLVHYEQESDSVVRTADTDLPLPSLREDGE